MEIERHTLALGGAGNVVSNLVALGAVVAPLGVVGNDDMGADRLREAFIRLLYRISWLPQLVSTFIETNAYQICLLSFCPWRRYHRANEFWKWMRFFKKSIKFRNAVHIKNTHVKRTR